MVSYVKDTVTVAAQHAMFQQDVKLRQLVRYYIIRVHVCLLINPCVYQLIYYNIFYEFMKRVTITADIFLH